MKFGPAGKSLEYVNTSTADTIKAISNLGLNAFEYQCGHGVKGKECTAIPITEAAEKYGVELSIHAPYYISLTNLEKLDNNIEYLRQCARLAGWFKAKRIVVHAGSIMNLSKDAAIMNNKTALSAMLETSEKEKWNEVLWCIETLGKCKQIGDYQDIVDICKIDERLIPCIDFGHLYARSIGTHTNFSDVFEYMYNELGSERAKTCHIHYSRITYTKGGEKHHLRIDDESGPDWFPIATLLKRYEYRGTVICESAGTQTIDCMQMQGLYNCIV